MSVSQGLTQYGRVTGLTASLDSITSDKRPAETSPMANSSSTERPPQKQTGSAHPKLTLSQGKEETTILLWRTIELLRSRSDRLEFPLSLLDIVLAWARFPP